MAPKIILSSTRTETWICKSCVNTSTFLEGFLSISLTLTFLSTFSILCWWAFSTSALRAFKTYIKISYLCSDCLTQSQLWNSQFSCNAIPMLIDSRQTALRILLQCSQNAPIMKILATICQDQRGLTKSSITVLILNFQILDLMIFLKSQDKTFPVGVKK